MILSSAFENKLTRFIQPEIVVFKIWKWYHADESYEIVNNFSDINQVWNFSILSRLMFMKMLTLVDIFFSQMANRRASKAKEWRIITTWWQWTINQFNKLHRWCHPHRSWIQSIVYTRCKTNISAMKQRRTCKLTIKCVNKFLLNFVSSSPNLSKFKNILSWPFPPCLVLLPSCPHEKSINVTSNNRTSSIKNNLNKWRCL